MNSGMIFLWQSIAIADKIPYRTTWRSLGLKGTPSILLVDKLGRLRRHFFGALDDLRLGTEIGLLLGEHYDEI